MPTFDVISEIDKHELLNAIDQANREISTRFDFKGVKASYEQTDKAIILKAENEFQLKQMVEIFQLKCAKRNIDGKCLVVKPMTSNLSEAKQEIELKQGIDKTFGKKIVQIVKDSGLKVQPSIQGEQVRITGKKKDDLQEAIAFLRAAKLDQPVQFDNFRD